jgi:DNA repair protein RecO (recombination protein O)
MAMEWSDRGIVLAARVHGENNAIVTLLTRERGRHAGLVRGGTGRRLKGVLQPGNTVQARWRGRLAEHLGTFTVEAERAAPAGFIEDAERLTCLSSACAMAERALPERHPYGPLFDGFLALLDALAAPGSHWGAVYVRWELGLLEQLGFGLDFSECAVTGGNDALVWVSPRSGRAVCASAGEPYRDKLLALPGFLVGGPDGGPEEVLAGLRLTGHFLERHLFVHDAGGPPPARERFVSRMARATTKSGVISSP